LGYCIDVLASQSNNHASVIVAHLVEQFVGDLHEAKLNIGVPIQQEIHLSDILEFIY